MIYTALGDSITFGENASSLAQSYPRLIVSALHSKSCRAQGFVLAQPGWNSYDLLDALIWHGAPVISHSSVVSVWIGGVDLANTALTSLRTNTALEVKQMISIYKRNLSNIFAQLQAGSSARIVCCTQYNPFPKSPLAVDAVSQLNFLISGISRQFNVTVAPAHKWFEGKQAELIYGFQHGKIEDTLGGFLPIHPNNRGHQVIAAKLAPFLFPSSPPLFT
jgi:lysophospholipase L1-like esterase